MRRKGGDLPEGVTAGNGSLMFNRPLGLTDAGIYQCVAYNVVGTGKAEVEITVTGMLCCYSESYKTNHLFFYFFNSSPGCMFFCCCCRPPCFFPKKITLLY